MSGLECECGATTLEKCPQCGEALCTKCREAHGVCGECEGLEDEDLEEEEEDDFDDDEEEDDDDGST